MRIAGERTGQGIHSRQAGRRDDQDSVLRSIVFAQPFIMALLPTLGTTNDILDFANKENSHEGFCDGDKG